MTVLLDQHLTLGRQDRRTLRRFHLDMPGSAGALRLRFDYTPRGCSEEGEADALARRAISEQAEAAAAAGVSLDELPPRRAHGHGPQLRNLVNLSLTDSDGRHRGRWDRNLAHQRGAADTICAGWATDGFVAGPLPAGRWQLTLEVHELVAAPVTRAVRVTGRPAAPPAPPPAGRRRVPTPAVEYPSPSPDGWIRGELHCHSTASDGLYEPAELVERAAALGLEFLSITDHNTMAALPALADAPLPIIPGCEVTTFYGHFCVYGLDEAPPWHRHERPLSPAQIQAAVPRGGTFCLAHPFVLGNPICCGCRLEAAPDMAAVDLLDGWSRGHAEPVADRHALLLYDQLRRAGHTPGLVCGRDWHGPAQEAAHAGRAFPAMMVRAPAEPGAILTAIARGDAYLTTGPLCRCELQGQGREAELRVRLRELAGPCELRVMDDGRLAHRVRLDGAPRAAMSFPVSADGAGARIELWSEAGAPLLLTNAVVA